MLVTGLILLIAIAILVWGYRRARPFGKLGLYAWLQSVALMAPWLLFFALFALGIYINLAGVLLLLVLSTGIYIYLGRQLRAMGQESLAAQRYAASTRQDPEIAEADGPGAEAAPPESPERPGEEAEANLPPGNLTPTANAATAEDADEVIPIPAADLAQIEGIFGLDTFFRTETVPYQDGAIFRGNLRGEPEATHQRLSASLAERLGDQYHLFLVDSNEGRPTVVVLPETVVPPQTTPFQWGVSGVLAIATLFTTLEAGGILQGFDLMQDNSRWGEALPLLIGLAVVLAAHEAAHWVVARRHGIRLSPPFLVPTWQLGSFGSLTRFESLLPNRQTLFDIALAGPAVGGLVSLSLLVTGLVLSHPGSAFQIPSDFFQGSILVAFLARVVLGTALQEPLVDVEPLFVIGWLGLVITALNLMPAGQLDGGRIVQAIYGRKTAGRTTLFTIVILALVSLVNPIALYWAAVIVVLQRSLERPCLNDITEPDDTRAAWGLLALFLMLATLLPLTPSLAGRLGIGA